MKNYTCFLPVLLIVCAFSMQCTSPPETATLVPGEGKLTTPDGEVWYKISGDGDELPVVLLHGGPAYASFYLKPFEALAADRPVIRYDQSGCGKSGRLTDESLFTVDHYVEELEALRKHLQIEKWHVYGHSWGTMLGMSYYNRYPETVASLTLASPCLSSAEWERSTRALLTSYPPELQEAVVRADSTGNYQDSLYLVTMNKFYEDYVFGNKVIEADLDSTMSTYGPEIYEHMWGASEFTLSGTLKDFDVTGDLPGVKVPVLLTVGEFDEINPEIVKAWGMEIPDSRVVIFEGASHMTPWNAEKESIEVQRVFLKESE